MRGKKLIVGIVMACFTLSLFTATAMAEQVLKVGIIGPFTGPSAKTGAEFKGSVTMAFEKVNNMVGDYKLEPVWIDSQSDPAKVVSAYAEAASASGSRAVFSTGTAPRPLPPWTWPPSTRCPTCSVSGPQRWSIKNGAAIPKNTVTGAARAGRFPLNSCPVMPRPSTMR